MGSRRRSAEEWRTIIAKWERSGQSKSEFAKTVGVKASTLGWWRWHLRSKPEVPSFVDVIVAEEVPERCPDFGLTVGNIGVRVPLGFDAQELRRLLGVLC